MAAARDEAFVWRRLWSSLEDDGLEVEEEPVHALEVCIFDVWRNLKLTRSTDVCPKTCL